MHSRKAPKDDRNSPQGSLRVWVAMAVVLFIVFMMGLGQWDWALAGIIGLVVGNGLQVLFSGR